MKSAVFKKVMPVTFLVLAISLSYPHQAHAGLFRKMLGAGALGEGVIYAESYDAVAAAVTGTGMAECAYRSCMADAVQKLIHIIQAHRIVGQKVVEKALISYATQHPDKSDGVARVRVEIGLGDGGGERNCGEDQYNDLKREILAACKTSGGSACKIKHGDDPIALIDMWMINRDKFQRCIDARNAMNDQCYNGGDRGHREQVRIQENGRKKCDVLITKYESLLRK